MRGAPLLDHLVGSSQKGLGYRQADRLCSPEVDDQIELSRLLHWQIGRLRSFEDLVHLGRDPSPQFLVIGAVAHEASCPYECASEHTREHRRPPLLESDLDDSLPLRSEEHTSELQSLRHLV